MEVLKVVLFTSDLERWGSYDRAIYKRRYISCSKLLFYWCVVKLQIEITVNGKLTSLYMKLDESGSAFFVEPIQTEEQVAQGV